jgi:Glycosyl transferase family 64 domain
MTTNRVMRRNVSSDLLLLNPPVRQPSFSSRNGLAARYPAATTLPSDEILSSKQRQTTTTTLFGKSCLFGMCLLMPMLYGVLSMYTLLNDLVQDHVSHTVPLPVTPRTDGNMKEEGITLPGFDSVLERALQHTNQCKALEPANSFRGFDVRTELPFHNDTVASLPSFGIVSAIQSYLESSKNKNADGHRWPICQMPPTNECNEHQLSVIVMAYNPDRLGKTLREMRKMFDPAVYFNLVKEVVLVWNGVRQIDESEEGKNFLDYIKDHPVRIVYPLKMGFPNDLMNRYHPDVVLPTTKALLYYDDDGPFYSYSAVFAGFELWKRHSHAQIGAMARQITYSARQQEAKVALLGKESEKKSIPADHMFMSHCTNVDDQVDYQFRYFANYDANMVLPSGSMLHANYLCYLWHPIFAEIRQFVLRHPVHPDDMTVSMIVSQLAGVAPRVYSRQLNPIQPSNGHHKNLAHHRRLAAEQQNTIEDDVIEEENMDIGLVPLSERQRHRSLMFSICWDCGAGMTEMKQYWAELRTEAVNSLVRYFGSINSGSIGWCTYQSEYYDVTKDGRCWPVMAKQGWLPWMNKDGTPKDTCP